MFGTVHDAATFEPPVEPEDVTWAPGVAQLEGLGFTRLGVEICLLPEPELPGVTAFEGEDGAFMQAVERKGSRSVVLRSPDGRTGVSPEFGFGMAMAGFLTVLANGQLVGTRMKPAREIALRDPVALARDVAEATDGEVSSHLGLPGHGLVLRAVTWMVGLSDGMLHPTLPGRGLDRKTVGGTLAEVYAAHQAHVAEVVAREGVDAVVLPDLATYHAAIRRKHAVMGRHHRDLEASQDRYGMWGAHGLAGLAVIGAVVAGVPPELVAVGVVLTALSFKGMENAPNEWVWWGFFLSPVWLGLVARVAGIPKPVWIGPLLLVTLLLSFYLLRELWGLVLAHRLYPRISATVRRPARVPAEELTRQYGE